jgi:hypothetical protein
MPATERQRYESTIRAALPESTSARPGGERHHDALAATLAQARAAGHDPDTLLQQAIDMRELDTADNLNDVLVWRLRRLADLPALPSTTSRVPKAVADTTTPTARRPLPPGPRPETPDLRNRPPRR